MRRATAVKLTMMLTAVASGVGSCMPLDNPLLVRVSNELACAPAGINVLVRGDVGYRVFDVEACGQRARYSCVGGHRYERYHCIREPDPPRWDPDPALAANLPPGPPGTPADWDGAQAGHWRRICGPLDRECAIKQDGAWRWRPYKPLLCADPYATHVCDPLTPM